MDTGRDARWYLQRQKMPRLCVVEIVGICEYVEQRVVAVDRPPHALAGEHLVHPRAPFRRRASSVRSTLKKIPLVGELDEIPFGGLSVNN